MELLKDELKKRGERQVRVAAKLGINPSRFTGFCNGWLTPTREQRSKIAQYLDLPEEKLFPSVKQSG